jgi:type II secretory pathway predicted ATPase ExeA
MRSMGTGLNMVMVMAMSGQGKQVGRRLVLTRSLLRDQKSFAVVIDDCG